MTVTVRRGFRSALRPEATVVFQVSTAEPPDLMALNAVTDEEGLERGPKFVSGPLPVPGGRLMMIDCGDLPPRTLRTVPDLVVDRLAAAGIAEATVALPRLIGDRYGTVGAFAPAARAFLAAPVAAPMGGSS